MNPYYQRIAARANHRCEYCRAPELVFNFPFEVEHIIPLCKQGKDQEDNLALACRSCNLRKGMQTSKTDPNSNVDVRLFHPRQDLWELCFQIDLQSGRIIGNNLIGRVSIDALVMNSLTQLKARNLWIQLGIFP